MRLSELPSELGIRIICDGEFQNLGFLEDSQAAKLAFLESEHLLVSLKQDSGVNCVVTTPVLAQELGFIEGIAESANPRLAFSRIHNYLAEKTDFYGSPKPTTIDPSAKLEAGVTVAEEDVVIGAFCRIGAHVWIGQGVQLGEGVVVQPGAVLGGVGLQVVAMEKETLDLLHAGRLSIEDRVVVMANSVIAKGLFRESTTIGSQSRIGNLAFVSHNVQIGARTIVGHQAVINGNVVIGEASWIGPNATISNNLKLGNNVKVSLGSVVVRDIPEGQRFTGPFAVQHHRMMRHLATYSGPGHR